MMRKKLCVLLALSMVLTAVLGLAGNALALSPSSDEAGANFTGIAYHGDPALCAMTADEARALAAKLGELMGTYNDGQYMDGFIRRAALVDMGSGVPALYYYEGVSEGETPNPLGPGLNGTMGFDGWNCSAWEFKDGALVRFAPGWYYDGYMVYEDLSGTGRSGATYVVPIRDGVMELLPDEDGYLQIDYSDCVAWYEWALGSWDEFGEGYDDYEDMYAGENGEYREVLENPSAGSALGIQWYNYVGLSDAAQIWLALDAYAAAREAADASDPTALVPGYGNVDTDDLSPELLRGYARTLRGLPDTETWEYSDTTAALYNFATLLRGGDGTVLLWVIPAVMDSEWWGNEQYFTYNGAPFIGRDHLLFDWDGANTREIRVPGVNEIRYWPEGVELMEVYYGTDVGGQPWEIMYGVEDGGLAAQPQWCHASGFLDTYLMEDAGLIDWIPADLETRRDVVRTYFDEYMAGRGEWPLLPLDWNTFTSQDMLMDTIDFDVYGGDYLSFRQAHEVYNAQYDYTYLDTSAAGKYSDIERIPGRWMLANELADRLDAMAELLEEESEPPVEDTEDREPDDSEPDSGESPEKDSPTAPEDERDGEKDGGTDRDGREDREEKKDLPVGLIVGAAALVPVLVGGAVTAAVLLSKKRRGKAAKGAGGQTSICPNCGAPQVPGTNFCTRCGTKL